MYITTRTAKRVSMLYLYQIGHLNDLTYFLLPFIFMQLFPQLAGSQIDDEESLTAALPYPS